MMLRPSVVSAGPYLCPHGGYRRDGVNLQQLGELALPTVGWDCTGASPQVDTYSSWINNPLYHGSGSCAA